MSGTYPRTDEPTAQPTPGSPGWVPAHPADPSEPGRPETGFRPFPLQTRDPRAKSPALACVLSMMPGLGQVYLGYYTRGFVHALVVAGLITLLATGDLNELDPMAGIFLAFFWLYNIIDAGRRASLYNVVLDGGETIELPRDFGKPSPYGSIFAGLALIGVGFILLLHTRFDVPLSWLEQWWPVAPMLFGLYLLGQAIQDRRS